MKDKLEPLITLFKVINIISINYYLYLPILSTLYLTHQYVYTWNF